MPAALDVDREAVKTLAVAVGVREAARQTGLSEDRVRQWSSRGNWFTPVPQPPSQGAVTTVTKPADALLSIIAEDKLKTRSGLARYTAQAAEKLRESAGNLKLSRPAKDIADIMGKVWPEQQNQSGAGIHIGVLTGQVAIQYKPSTEGVSE